MSAESVARAFKCINVDDTDGKASFDDLFQIAMSLDHKATKEDSNHTWLLLAHYVCAMSTKIDDMSNAIADVRTASKVCVR